jgi:hypothetical protein
MAACRPASSAIQGRVLWCVSLHDLFAPALAQAGLAPDRVIYVESGDEKAVLACFEEALRHPMNKRNHWESLWQDEMGGNIKVGSRRRL